MSNLAGQVHLGDRLQVVDKASKAKRKVSNSPYNRIIYLAALGFILDLFFSIGIKSYGEARYSISGWL